MYQPSTNFIGKDGMEWWIGQVTDPKKGKWDAALEKTQADNGEEIYSHRCRVQCDLRLISFDSPVSFI